MIKEAKENREIAKAELDLAKQTSTSTRSWRRSTGSSSSG